MFLGLVRNRTPYHNHSVPSYQQHSVPNLLTQFHTTTGISTSTVPYWTVNRIPFILDCLYTCWSVYIQLHIQCIHSCSLFCFFPKLYLVIVEHLTPEAKKLKLISGSRSIPKSMPEVYPEVYPEACHATDRGPARGPLIGVYVCVILLILEWFCVILIWC